MPRARVAEARPDYDREAEQSFRRELEIVLGELFTGIVNVTSGSNGSASLYSKRESLTIPQVGMVTYG